MVGGAGFWLGFGGLGARQMLVRNVEAIGVAPEAFEVVILAGAFAENVDDEIAVIEQEPFCGTGFAFAMGEVAAALIEALFDGLGDGPKLRLALPGTENEIFGECAGIVEMQYDNAERLLFLGRFDGKANFRTN